MHRASFFALTALATAALASARPAFAQTAPPDSQLTQALLTEIRQLRQDLQTTAITIQRVQIVMYRLQAAATLMSRATQRLDDARAKCSQAQSQRKMMATQIEQSEEKLRNTQTPPERKGLEDMIPRLKANLDMWTNEEQQCQSKQADAEAQFRSEQARVNEMQDQLDKLDRALDSYGRK